jgi:hypothetical protein
MAARHRKNASRVVFSDYKVDPEMGLAARIADSLSWYAEVCPNRVVSWPELMKTVRQDRRKWPEDSDEIKRFKGQKGHADKLMIAKYGKVIITVPGEGVRGSTGSEDIIINHTPKAARRATKAMERFKETTELVNTSEVRDKETRTYARNMKRTCTELTGAIEKLNLLEGKREERNEKPVEPKE